VVREIDGIFLGIFDLGDNDAILVARVAMRIYGVVLVLLAIVGNNAGRWPLKHSGLSGYMVYFGRCDAG
jgi:hypothetical protein